VLPKRLGSVLKALRKREGLSLDALAKRAEVTKPYLSMLESGHRKNPSLNVLRRLARALGVPVTQLLE
jgi:XRE family transcriptional regulator of biofilm formation